MSNRKSPCEETISVPEVSKGLLLTQIATEMEIVIATLSNEERFKKKAKIHNVNQLAKIQKLGNIELPTLWLTDKVMETLTLQINAFDDLKLHERI